MKGKVPLQVVTEDVDGTREKAGGTPSVRPNEPLRDILADENYSNSNSNNAEFPKEETDFPQNSLTGNGNSYPTSQTEDRSSFGNADAAGTIPIVAPGLEMQEYHSEERTTHVDITHPIPADLGTRGNDSDEGAARANPVATVAEEYNFKPDETLPNPDGRNDPVRTIKDDLNEENESPKDASGGKTEDPALNGSQIEDSGNFPPAEEDTHSTNNTEPSDGTSLGGRDSYASFATAVSDSRDDLSPATGNGKNAKNSAGLDDEDDLYGKKT